MRIFTFTKLGRALLMATAVVFVWLSGCGGGGSSGGGGSGSFTDSRDGQTYKTVKIGNQTWMAENLNYQPQSGRSWCYENDTSNCNLYGRLYDWNTAGTACPAGFHLPSHEEWNVLEKAVGGNAGKKLKARSGWGKNGNGTDAYGFLALPNGGYFDGDFRAAGWGGYWWTATVFENEGRWWSRIIVEDENRVSGSYGYRNDGFAVRCLKDG